MICGEGLLKLRPFSLPEFDSLHRMRRLKSVKANEEEKPDEEESHAGGGSLMWFPTGARIPTTSPSGMGAHARSQTF